MELLITFLVGLALMEIYAWLPRACEWIVGLAIRLLPPDHRERWGEEFEESQSALPQTAWRLLHAISLFCCALLMRRSLTAADAEAQLDRFDEEIASVVSQYRAAEAKLDHIDSTIASGRSQIVKFQAQAQSQLQALSSQSAQAGANDVTKCAAALGNILKTVCKAHDRAADIFAVQTDTFSKALNDAAPLVKRVGRNWKFTRRVRPIARKVPFFGPIVFRRALSAVLRDSERLRSCLECLESDGLAACRT